MNDQESVQKQKLSVSVSDLTTKFPFKEMRPKQLHVLEQIANAINSGFKYIVLEAPNGFGKSPVAVAALNYFFD
jgi:Rad3-related DNA helicase